MLALSYEEAMENSPIVLTLTLDNSQPIALTSFVKAFTSLADEYRDQVRKNADFENEDAEIFVKEVRQGSIIADLIPYAIQALPIIASELDQIYLVVEFVNKWKERLISLTEGIVPPGSSKSDLKRWMDGVEAIARDPKAKATLEAATFEDGKRQVRAAFTFQSSEAKKIRATASKEIERIEKSQNTEFTRVLMVFTRSDVSNAKIGKRSGERVLVQQIYDRSLALTYGSELAEQRIKHEIRESDENIYKKGFIVDVNVQYVGTRPVAYSIIEVREVIDLPTEEQ